MLKKILLVTFFIFNTSYDLFAQDEVVELQPVNEFYERFTKMIPTDSIRYQEGIKQREKKIAQLAAEGSYGCSLSNAGYGAYIKNYYNKMIDREVLKIVTDTLVNYVSQRNMSIGKDSISVIKVTAVKAINSALSNSHPEYGYSNVFIESIDVSRDQCKYKSFADEKVYYFLNEIGVKLR